MNKMIHPFEKPSFTIATEDEKSNYGKFSIEPLEKGFGLTLGNALRRVLIGAISGASVFAIKIEGASHEFCALPGVSEDVTAIILNLKKLVLKIDGNNEDTKELTIDVHGPCTVYAKDIVIPSDVEVINGDLPIATVNEDGHLKMSLFACNGRGYVTSDENAQTKSLVADRIGYIATDSNFSPIVKVNYTVDPARVGHESRFDKLTIEVTTDGSVKPSVVISQAADMLIGYFEKFTDLASELDRQKVTFKEKEVAVVNKNMELDIFDCHLSQRSSNALKRAGFQKIGQLTQITQEQLASLRSLGKKSIKEIEDLLEELGLSFKKEN